ncbi:MAG: nucleotide sugar dehydrogenase [Candidatus Omnitrophota bacterium]
MTIYSELKRKIKNKDVVISVVGLGYVGLPIALEFVKKGFTVNGLDSNKQRVKDLRRGVSYVTDISGGDIKRLLEGGKFRVTSKEKVLAESDVIIICVPTPLNKIHEPDISYVVSVSNTMRRFLRRGQVVILESTTYPGTTREVILPILQTSGLKVGEDFHLAFSPERIDPGNKKYDLKNIPKIIGGFTPEGTEMGKIIYSLIIKKVISASTPETAEVTKLLENTFRIVNIGLINEFADLCHRLKIDVWEVIKAAKTKPFGFMPFYPGPGIGGHCIPADPMYLSWKARKVGFKTKMIDLAAVVNRSIPSYIVKRAKSILSSRGKQISNANILIIGVSYKKDINDLRESPSLDIISLLKKNKAVVSYHDPYVPKINMDSIKEKSCILSKTKIQKQDLVIIVTDHSCIDYKKIVCNSSVIFDTRNACEENKIKSDKIIKL